MSVVPQDMFLEIMNGNWAILATFTAVYVSYHLIDVAHRRGVTLQKWFTDLPQSMQLAVAFLTVSVGVIFSRAPVWFWRFMTDGDPLKFSAGIKMLLTIGAALGCFGYICAIRVITRPMRSHWPWITAALCAVLYTVGTLILRSA